MKETHQLLHEYATSGSEGAFKELVSRYIDLVYSVALRRVGGDVHHAEDLVQTVFTDLSRKASTLPSGVMLGGWLHRHCCFVASNHSRAELRRRLREREAVRMQSLQSDYDSTWDELAPVVDDAIQHLDEPDRDAISLRYLERRDLRAIGTVLGISEDAAQKRVSRAIEKLRLLLVQRGLTLSITTLTGMLGTHCVTAAPSGWAGRIAAAALENIPVHAGLAAALLSLLAPTTGKIAAVIATAALIIVIVAWDHRAIQSTAKRTEPAETISENSPTRAASALSALPVTSTIRSDALPANDDPTALRLIVVSADSGEPVPTVRIDYRGWEKEKFTGKQLSSDRLGICSVVIPRETVTQLELTSRKDGFADTRLSWRPDRGDKIPLAYTLKLARSVPIGGRVINEQGEPVAGAKVGFNHSEDPVSASATESHEFSWIEVETDPQGNWEIDRIADEVIRRIYGSARHPDYLNSEHIFVSKEPAAEEKLRAGKHLFQLPNALTVRGFVTDPEGYPVPDAKVLLGNRGSSGARTATLALDGSFEIKGAKPGKNLITAEANRYAPSTIEFIASTNAEPIRITLTPGKVLKIRVVNREGQPVPKARLWLDTFEHGPIGARPESPISQAEFSPVTDEAGQVVWNQAPDRELKFDAFARGYMRVSGVKIRPDGSEHIITLPPGLTISGRVTDAATGKPIPRFKVITGWPQTHFEEGKIVPQWSTIDRFWLSFSDGEFEHVYEEPVLGGTPDPKFIFKFEAEGYAPHITRVVKADEGVVKFDLALKAATASRITVLLPNGEPAPRTDVLLASEMDHVELGETGFSRHGGAIVHVTDERGQIRIQPEEHVAKVYAANAQGFAQASPAHLAEDPRIQLQPWGRIEGTLSKRGKGISGRTIVVTRDPSDQKEPSVRLSSTKTDPEGKFTFPKTPAGKFRLAYLSPVPGQAQTFGHVSFAVVEVLPGQTAVVDHSDVGIEIIARFRWPDDAAHEPGLVRVAAIHTPFPMPPAEVLQNPNMLTRWRELPEVKAKIASHHSWQLSESSDGIWKSPPIPAGIYVLNFAAIRPGTNNQPGEPILQARMEVTIPADFAGEAFDLGEIAVQKAPFPAAQ